MLGEVVEDGRVWIKWVIWVLWVYDLEERGYG